MFSQALPTFDTFIFTTSFSYKYVNFAHYTWENRIFCLSEVFCDPNISQKCVSGWGYASDPPGELTMHPGPRPGIVGWGGDTPPQTQPHSAPSASRFSRSSSPKRIDPRALPQAWCPYAVLGLVTALGWELGTTKIPRKPAGKEANVAAFPRK